MRNLKIAIIAFGIISGSLAVAGGMEGGGGKSVVCRNQDGSIRSAEILDLYEGRTVYQLNYHEAPDNWQTQAPEFLKNALGGLSQSAPRSEIYDWYLNAIEHLTYLPKGTSLKPINDSDEPIVPNGCMAEQTVNYMNDQLILVSGEIWDALSETQRAALLIHESTYRYLRQFGETDSRRARHYTVFLLAGGHSEEIFPGNNYQLYCEGDVGGKATQFFALKLPPDQSGKSAVRLQFGILGGRHLLSRSYVDIKVDYMDLISQLKNPNQWVRFDGLSLTSLFEPNDIIDLWFHPDDKGNWQSQILGTSAFDGSPIDSVNIKCF